MTQLYTNNASSVLAIDIDETETQIVLDVGAGSLFPQPEGVNDFFMVSLQNTVGQMEITKCTNRAGDTFIVERGQEGTTPIPFAADSRVECRLTALTMSMLMQANAAVLFGNLNMNGNNINNGGAIVGMPIRNENNSGDNQIVVPVDGDPTIGPDVIWHEGNDGYESGLVAGDTKLHGGEPITNVALKNQTNIFTEPQIIDSDNPRMIIKRATASDQMMLLFEDEEGAVMGMVTVNPDTKDMVLASRDVVGGDNGGYIILAETGEVVVHASDGQNMEFTTESGGDVHIIRSGSGGSAFYRGYEIAVHEELYAGRESFWRNQTGGRAIGTTYTNNWPKPLGVAVSLTLGSNEWARADVGQATPDVQVAHVSSSNGVERGTLSFTVPPGDSYRVVTVGGNPALLYWAELY